MDLGTKASEPTAYVAPIALIRAGTGTGEQRGAAMGSRWVRPQLCEHTNYFDKECVQSMTVTLSSEFRSVCFCHKVFNFIFQLPAFQTQHSASGGRLQQYCREASKAEDREPIYAIFFVFSASLGLLTTLLYRWESIGLLPVARFPYLSISSSFAIGLRRSVMPFCRFLLAGGRRLQQANSCLMQEWLHMAGGHIKVEYCAGSHLKESGFRCIDLSLLALALSLGRGLRRRIVARVRGVLGHLPHTASLWLAVWLATAVPTSRA